MSTRQSTRRAISRHSEQTHGRARRQFFSPSLNRKSRALRFEKLDERRVLATMYGATVTNGLVTFDSATPGTTAVNPITGLGAGEVIQGLDVRPATGQLYALGITDDGATRTGRILTINPATAAATVVGTFSNTLPDVDGWGFDFNPTVDRIRIVSTSGLNLRVNPNNGALAGTDTPLATTGIEALAYDRNVGSSISTLYAYNHGVDQLATIGGIDGTPSPNGGTVTNIGPSGITAFGPENLDIESGTNIARFSAAVGGVQRLYTINLATGAATLIGAIGAGATPVRGLTSASTSAFLNGTEGNDSITLVRSGANIIATGVVNGPITFPDAGLASIEISTLGGNDTLTLDFSGGTLPTLNATVENVVYTGAGGNDTLAISTTGANAFSTNLNSGFFVGNWSGLTSFGFNGAGGNDNLSLTYNAGGSLPTINYDGGAGGLDTLTLGGGLAATTVTHNFTNASDGSVAITGQGTINYLGLDPIVDNLNAANRVFNFTGGVEAVTLADTAGANITRIQSTLGELVDFLSPTASLTVNLSAGTGADSLTINQLDAAFAVPITVNLNNDGNSVVLSSAGTLDDAVTVNGGSGSDTVTVAGTGHLEDVTGAVIFLGNGGTDTAILNDSAHNGSETYTITNTNFARAGFGGLSYNTIENLQVNGELGNTTINVNSTAPGTAYLINSAAGNDIVNIGTGDLDAIAGPVTVNGGGDTDQVNLNDSTDAGVNTFAVTSTTVTRAPGTFAGLTYGTVEGLAITATGGDTVNVNSTNATTPVVVNFVAGNNTVNVSNTSSSLTINGGTGNDVANLTITGHLEDIAGPVVFNGNGGTDTANLNDAAHLDAETYTVTSTTVNRTNGFGGLTYGTIEALNMVTAANNDAINVNSTAAGVATTISGFNGLDTFNIEASLLGGTNTFNGDANDDTFNLNINQVAGITAPVLIQGGANDFAGGVGSRDVVRVNENFGLLVLGIITYTGNVGGSEVTLGGLVSLVTVNTSETIDYNGSAGNNDQITVVGRAGVDDLLTVAPVNANRALVFNGGNPFDGPPENNATSLPGVSGGSTAPDLDLSGLDSATGLIIQDAGGAADRLYVYGESEADLVDGNTFDPFGFGAGVLMNGIAVPGSYDDITVTDTFVQVDNFVRVNFDNVDFRQPLPDQLTDPAVVVNAGFETTNSIGTADDITVTPSAAYKFQINGGDPDPATTGIVPPNGDRLNFGGALGVVNVFATKDAGGGPPVISLEFPGSGNLPVSFSSIEDFGALSATTVNLIGDNNDPAVDQNDDFRVVGTDVDGDLTDGGYQEFQLFINNSVVPLVFNDVQFLNVYGFDLQTGGNDVPANAIVTDDVDTLELRPYADYAGNPPNNAPRGWGINTFFNEGEPDGQDGAQDLLIYHTSQGVNVPPNVFGGGSVSENIVVQPSGLDNGELRVTNVVDGSIIVVVQYVNNTDLIVRDDDGSLTDTDTVTLNGTNPNAAGVSGNDTFTFNADADMTLAEPLVTVTDSNNPANILYRLREYTTTGNAAGFFLDSLTIDGLAGDDTFNLVGGSTNQQNDQYLFLGGEGADTLNIDMPNAFMFDGTGLFFDGGSGLDALTVRNTAVLNNAVTTTEYIVGSVAGSGQLVYDDGFSVDMVIDFVNLEPVVDLVVSAELIVTANNASNAINYTVGAGGATNGLVSIDDRETIEFSNKVQLTIEALAGSDTINLNNPNTPTSLTTIEVNAGNPTDSDTLIVNGRAGLQDQMRLAPTAQGAGSITQTGVPVRNYTGIEHIRAVMDPLASDHFSVDGTAGNDHYRITSGPATGEMIITGEMNANGIGFLLPTITATGQSNALIGTLNFNGVGGTDTLSVTGTSTNDTFNLTRSTATSGSIDHEINGVQTQFIGFANFTTINVDGGDGDDTFNTTGDFPTAVNIRGGNPSSGSDVLNFTASATVANLVTVDFAASTIGEATFPTQSFTGIEVLNGNVNGHSLTVLGTVGDDSVTVSPTGAAAATITRVSSAPAIAASPVVNASALGATFTVDLLAGSDNLRVNGTQAGEIIAVTPTVVTVGALKTVTYAGAENLQVFGQAGSDTFNVTPSATTTMFIDGGDPIGTSGDTLNLTPPGAFTLQPGPEPDEGGMVGAAVQRVSWDHIEDVIVGGGGPGLILGTNGDDDITIIARDVSTHAGTDGVQDFTVTVNDSFSALFINQPTLFVDALAGDDDIVVRAPAPNGAVWNVQITLVGGPPASVTGDQGDVLELETPGGAEAVIFSPTGPETGTLTLDQATDSVISFVSSFTFDPAGINYISSPGGIEQVVYDGVSGVGNDTVTINGTVADETLKYSSELFGGTFRSNFSPTFDFSRTGNVTFNGGGGFDVANLGGSAGIDAVTSTATAVTMNSPGADVVLTIGTAVEKLTISTGDGNDTVDLDLQVVGLAKTIDAGAGNDNVNLAGLLIDPADPTIFGGDGDDILVGSPNPDIIFGSFGNDVLVGGAGIDFLYGEEGNDIFGNLTLTPNAVADDAGNDFAFGGEGFDNFVWEPGDGADINNGGGDAADIFRFFGSAAANTFILRSGGTQTHLNALIGAVNIDNHGIEDVVIDGQGGGDTFTIEDVYATELVSVNIVQGAGLDTVTIQGRDVTDAININNVAANANVTGLRYNVRVQGTTLADADVLIFNGNDGNDNIVINEATSALYAAANLRVNGGNGNDFISGHGLLSGDAGDDNLVGGEASQAIFGGTGNDFINGGIGLDTMDGGAGEDTFLINFDTGDNYIGGADYDTVLILGTSGNDVVAANQTAAGTLVSSLNGVNDTDSLATIERVRLEANSGDDIIFVQHLDGLSDAAINSVLFDVDGGAAFTADRLVVQDNGASNVMIYRKAETATNGSITVGPALAEPLYTVFTGVEFVDPLTGTPGNIFVFKYDPFEWNGNFQNATHLGAGLTLNADPVIDPGVPTTVLPPGFVNPPADDDFYRIEAQETGTLDVQVFFRHNAGLPGGGDINIDLLDVDGSVIATDIDADDNARVRIPAVEGQIYFLRVYQGVAGALNTYSMTIVNETAPVPFDLELDDAPVNGTTNPPGQADNSDTGRSQNDNITYDNTPTIVFRVPDNELINDVPDNSPGQPGAPVDGAPIPINFQADTGNNALAAGFRVAVYRTENNTRVHVGYASALGNGVYQFTFPAAIPDGSNFISARVEMVDPTTPDQNQGFGAFSTDLEIFVDIVVPPVFFGQQSIAGDGLHPNSDSGVLGPANTPTLSDGITNDTTPTFWGRAEANANIRAYVDAAPFNGIVDAADIFIGFTTAIPYDGTNQMGNPVGDEPNGYWELTSVVNLNSQAVLTAVGVPPGETGGLRQILISAEDVAGNITSIVGEVQLLNIFVDDQGPQITGVSITGFPGFDLFDPKASDAGHTPTPLVDSLTIGVQDFPVRLIPGIPGLTDSPALQESIAEIAAHYQVRGDFNGIIPIESVTFIPAAPIDGEAATGTLIIDFFTPLPDDRFTLTIDDDVVDPAGNPLDGESNASEPQEDPIFPSGDGVPGGDFVARFTVDTRPELGTWAAGSSWIDTNGNSIFDQDNLDYTNRDIAYLLGYTSDELFAGNFANGGVADGFDKLAAYGKVGANWRWQIDTDNDGVPNINIIDPAGINGFPVSGDFDPLSAGDEVGLFTGSRWFLDNDGDFNLQAGVTQLGWTFNGQQVIGYGFTGDFDNDGVTDLGSWTDDVFYLDLSTLSGGNPNGIIDRAFRFGFPGARERPIAHDFDQDGFDDVGLWSPDRSTQTPGDDAEWYILVSGGASLTNRIQIDPIPAPGAITPNVIPFTPVPFGNDLYYQYGDEFSLPMVGNFDPPVTPLTPADLLTFTNPRNSLDVNNDGRITAFDALEIINRLNLASGPLAAPRATFVRAPFIDTDGSETITAFDVIPIINYLNLNPIAAGEAVGSEDWSAGEGIDEELLYLLATDDREDDE